MKYTNRMTMKPLSELNLLDRFLFAVAMEDRETLELVLRIIVGRNLKIFDAVQTEKELRTAPWLRAIRLDVMSMDEKGVYDAEVQVRNTGNLERRSRFYQALIDSSLLPPGEVDFNQMQDSTIIFISPFDLFGKGKYRYTFRMKCEEAEDVELGDGATRIFLNTHGENPEEVSEELVELLRYFEHSTDEVASECQSGRIQELHRRISRIKSNEEIGVRYMQAWEEKIYDRMEAKEEGQRELLKSQIEKKLQKGKTIDMIADELEQELSLIKELIEELEKKAE
ncbi:MAG: Rpn family recombination-promoting nuclease/putative transposase [Eubacteriales bacterium]|nr:Rpn family recombination-promoting nuclease/putative transposase [Eubacteriales bacterium]